LTTRLKPPTLERKSPWGVLQSMTVTVKNKTPLVAPPAVRRRAGLKSGDRLEFKVSGKVITIRPKAHAADDEYTPAERRSIDRGIALSEKEYAAGKPYGPFDNHEAFIASLHRESAKLSDRKTKRAAR
jgi:bifunctional DNA-binding transcriptional regulator/antitoxin component of YhaV-PrlF toxin-antitoxin module